MGKVVYWYQSDNWIASWFFFLTLYLNALLMRLIITCPCSWFNAKKRQFHFGQFFFVNLLMLFYITKLSSVFCFFFSLLSLSISLITFSPIHHSGVAPAHWLKPLCCQVIFLLAGSKIVWLTLSFDSISLHWFCVVFLILIPFWSKLCVSGILMDVSFGVII